MQRVMVVGGPGNISSSTIQDLVDKGFTTGLFSYPSSPFDEVDSRVKIYPGDRDQSGQLETACKDFKPNVIVDLACFHPDQAKRAVVLADGLVSQYIFASTVDVYGYPLSRLPMRETDPWQPGTRSRYAENKRQCETILCERMHPEHFDLTIVRPAYSFGPRFILSALDRAAGPTLLYHLQNGLPVMIPGDGTTLLHASSGYNTGRMVARLVLEEKARNKIYNLAHPTVMEYENYIRMFAEPFGREPVLVHIPSDVILSVEDEEMENNLLDELIRYNVFFSTEKFQVDFPDFVYEPLPVAARRAVKWNLIKGNLSDRLVIDDRIIIAYQEAMQNFIVNKARYE